MRLERPSSPSCWRSLRWAGTRRPLGRHRRSSRVGGRGTRYVAVGDSAEVVAAGSSQIDAGRASRWSRPAKAVRGAEAIPSAATERQLGAWPRGTRAIGLRVGPDSALTSRSISARGRHPAARASAGSVLSAREGGRRAGERLAPLPSSRARAARRVDVAGDLLGAALAATCCPRAQRLRRRIARWLSDGARATWFGAARATSTPEPVRRAVERFIWLHASAGLAMWASRSWSCWRSERAARRRSRRPASRRDRRTGLAMPSRMPGSSATARAVCALRRGDPPCTSLT